MDSYSINSTPQKEKSGLFRPFVLNPTPCSREYVISGGLATEGGLSYSAARSCSARTWTSRPRSELASTERGASHRPPSKCGTNIPVASFKHDERFAVDTSGVDARRRRALALHVTVLHLYSVLIKTLKHLIMARNHLNFGVYFNMDSARL